MDIAGLLEQLTSRLSGFGGLADAASPFTSDPRIAGNPFTQGMAGFKPPQFQGFQSQPGPFQNSGFNVQSPFQGMGFRVQSPFQGGFNPTAPFRGNPLASLSGYNPWKTPPTQPNTGKPNVNGGMGSPNGMNFDGPATASDNAALSAQTIDAYIQRTRPGSPLVGMGAYILAEANRQGVSVPLLLGITLLESGMGSDGSYLPSVYNYGGLTGSGWEGQTGNTTGMARAFATFSSKEAGIKALISNLATDRYRGKSVRQQIGTWYLGNPNAGLGDADEQGNASVQQYLNTVGSVYNGLGINWNPDQGGTPRPNTSGTGMQSAMPGNLRGIWGGGNAPIMQEFGRTDYSDKNPYNYGGDFGMGNGHHGVDISLTRGSRLFAPQSGTVIIAGGSGYFRDDMGGGDGPGRGELRLRLDNGDEVILGHMAQIAVRVNQRVNAGDFVGFSGGADGAHLHLEWRVQDKSTGTGWRVVDPRTKMQW